jgi:hypothetical protein
LGRGQRGEERDMKKTTRRVLDQAVIASARKYAAEGDTVNFTIIVNGNPDLADILEDIARFYAATWEEGKP